jgi:hypothetical protein
VEACPRASGREAGRLSYCTALPEHKIELV